MSRLSRSLTFASLILVIVSAIATIWFAYRPWQTMDQSVFELSNPEAIAWDSQVFKAPVPFELGDTVKGEMVFTYENVLPSSIPYFQIIHYSDYDQLSVKGPRIPNPLYDSEKVYTVNSTSKTYTEPFSLNEIPTPGQYYFVVNGRGAVNIALRLAVERKTTSSVPTIAGGVVTVCSAVATFVAREYEKRESSRSQEEKRLVQKMKTIVDTFKPIMVGTSEIAIKKIALDLLKSEGVGESLGKGVAGWRTFFELHGDSASERFNRVAYDLNNFIKKPRNGKRLQGLVVDFKRALSDHYTSLACFHQMLKDVGAKEVPISIENRYKSFREEYNSLIQKLRDIVDDLDRQGASLRGTVMLNFVDELEQRYGFAFPSRFA